MDLYHMPLSPPCHSIRLLAKAMGLQLNLIHVDLLNGEHLKPEFLKINPQHQIPTLIDNGFTLWESRAIMAYFCEKYGKDDSLYPKDPQKRALVNQRLFFDQGTLYQRFSGHFYPQILHGQPAPEGTFKQFEDALEFLEVFLGQSAFVAGDVITIADFAVLASVTTFKVAAGLDLSKYANIEAWYAKMTGTVEGHEEICVQGAQEFAPLFQAVGKAK